MLTSQRKALILETLAREGQVVAKAMAERFDLSEDTIRRDLRELAAEGLLQRVHGGALPASPALADFGGRQSIGRSEKARIGRAAAAMLRPGQVVFIDGGTTAAELVRHLAADLAVTVVTHSPTIAVELLPKTAVEVVLIGGRLFRHSVVAVGAGTAEAIAAVKADTVFLGVTGLHPAHGLTTGDFEEARIKRAMIEAAAECVVLASPEKINAVSPWRVAPLDRAGAVVAIDPPADFAEACGRAGVQVVPA